MRDAAQVTTSLYVRLEADQDMAMREAVRASPDRYDNLTDFVRVAINNQLKREKSRSKTQKE